VDCGKDIIFRRGRRGKRTEYNLDGGTVGLDERKTLGNVGEENKSGGYSRDEWANELTRNYFP